MVFFRFLKFFASSARRQKVAVARNRRNSCSKRGPMILGTLLETSESQRYKPLRTPRGKAHLGQNPRCDCSSKVAAAQDRRNGCRNGAHCCSKLLSKHPKVAVAHPCDRREERHTYANIHGVTVRPNVWWRETVAAAAPNGAQ